MTQNNTIDNLIIPNNWSTCDGQQLKQLFKAALVKLENHYEHVNQLNVFPIPDGDTGTNMLLTMRKAYGAIQHSDNEHIGQIVGQFARGALMEARGNSGVILSQIFQGLADGLKTFESAKVQAFASAFQLASEKAYKSVSDPTEGTILTVIRETAVSASTFQGEQLRPFFETLHQQSKQTVAQTPDLLPILKQSGVVDSGGQGLVYCFQGIVEWLNGELQTTDAGALETVVHQPAQAHAIPEGGKLENPFDVQFLLYGKDLDVEAVRAKMDAIGDSTVVVGDESLIRVHVHVKNPGEPLSYGVQLGQIDDVIVENMQLQMEAIVGVSTEETAVPTFDVQEGQIGVVAIVPGAGFVDIFKSMRAAHVVHGGQSNNPSVEDILQAIEAVSTDQIILLPNNKNVLPTAETARRMSSKQVKVVPTKTVPQGLNSMVVLDVNGDLEKTAVSMEAASKEVITAEVTRATRSANFDNISVSEGDVIGLIDGFLTVSGEEVMAVVLQLLRSIEMAEVEIISLYTGRDASTDETKLLLQQLRAAYPNVEFETLYGGQPHYNYILGIE